MRQWLNQSRERIQALIAAAGIGLVIGLVASVLCLWIFAQLADEVQENDFLVTLDVSLANAIHANVTPEATSAFLFITTFGSQVVWVLTIALSLYYVWRRQWLSLVIWLVALGGGELLNYLLKQFFARARPVFDNPIVVERFFSFPSGHSMLSMITYGMLAYFVLLRVKNRATRLLVIASATLMVLMVGLSRIYLGVHYLSDVLAGFAAGGMWLFTCISVREFIVRRTQPSATT